MDISSNKPDLQEVHNHIKNVSLSDDGKLIAIIGYDERVPLFEVDHIENCENKNENTENCENKNINLITNISNSEFYNGKTKLIEFLPNGNNKSERLVTVEKGDVEKGDVIKLWDILSENLKCIDTIETQQKNVDLVAFTSKEDLMVTRGKDDGKIKLWKWNFKKNKFEDEKKNLSGTELDNFQNKPSNSIYSVSLSSNGKYIVTTTKNENTDDNNLWLWKTNGEKVDVISTKQKDAYVAFSPDGKQLATGGKGGVIKLWDIERYIKRDTNKPIKRFKTQLSTIYSIVFSPNGNKLVTIGPGKNKNREEKEKLLEKWKKSGREKIELRDRFGNTKSVNMWNTFGNENLVKLWDRSGNEIKQFETPLEVESIKRVKFSRNGKQLITIGQSGNLRLWKVGDMKELRKQACNLFGNHSEFKFDENKNKLCN